MKKIVSSTLALLCMFAFSTQAAAADEKIYKLNMTTQYMEKHPVVQNVWLPWAETIKKETNGRVEITFFNPGTLCPEPEHFEATRKGQIDIGHNPTGRNQGRLPISVIADTPNVMTTPMAGAAAMWKLYQETPELQAEYKGIKIFAMHTSAPNVVDFAKGEAKKLEDMKGKRILVNNGENARMMRNLGANAIVTPVPDFYLSLSRNMADACYLPIAPLRSFKIDETLKSITVCNLSMGAFWFGMNEGVWNSLPKDIQAVFDKHTGLEFSIAIGQALYDGDQKDSKTLAANGVVLNKVTPQERQRWVKACEAEATKTWFKTMEQRKIKNAKQIHDRALAIFKEAEAKYSK